METSVGPHTLAAVLLVLVALALTSLPNAIGQEVNSMYRDWYVPESRDSVRDADVLEPSIGIWKPVSPGWGIPDTTATVGVAFSYTIPKEAFRGDVDKYEIREVGTQSLPKWLYFCNKTNKLEGIPGLEDERQHFISVTAFGKESNITKQSSNTKDVFSVNVLHHDAPQAKGTEDSKSTKHQDGVVVCPPEKPAVRATIILDADWTMLTPQERVHVVSKMSRYSRVSLTAFRLLPEKQDVKGYQALAAGSGNVVSALHEGLSLSWVVGCGRNADQLPVVTILEGASKDGSMAEKLGYDIKGWHVSSNTPIVKNRVRRQVPIMGTPVPTPLPTGAPKPTEIAPTTVTPSTHIVPSESSPVLSSMIRTAGTQDTMTMMVSDTQTTPGKVSVSPTVKASKTSFYKTPAITPTPTPTAMATQVVTSSAVPTEAPTRTFSPPVPSMTSTKGLPSVPTVTSAPVSSATLAPMTPSTVVIMPTPTEPVTTPSAPTTPTTPTPKETTTKANRPPKNPNPVERIDVFVGVPLVYVIPANTFYDPEQGDTRNLDLTLLTLDGLELSSDFWLKLDKNSQTIFGYTDKVLEPASYVLVAQDRGGIYVRDVFDVHVIDSNTIPTEPPPVAMGATLNIDFDEFVNNPALQLDILNRIASVYGDPDASALTITGIRRGSVILSFTNNTIPKDSCPIDLIQELMMKLVDEDGKPTQELIDAFAPEYQISGVEASPQGTCDETTPAMTTQTTKAFPPSVDTGTKSNDAWITNVLPGVIVAFIIILAGIVVFILYRKNRKGKLSDEDQNTFINKGIPIIFAEELDEGDKQPSSTPLIMKNEKPPLPPPEYSAEDGTRQPLLNDNKPSDDADKPGMPMVDLGGSPPYEPPPPLTSSPPESRNPHSSSTTRYQSPPAYVPP
ncbi:dystroglycan 1-like [Diadema antillarum]|uniref:dystroglycan 1-like n=1 Tax=Diadema antillarum TaxID=105358 RepID=UPI003A886C09